MSEEIGTCHTDVTYNDNNGLTDLHLTTSDIGITSVVGATLTNY